MRVEVEPGVRLFVDVDGVGWVPDGPRLREKPTLILLHGGPGFDHSSFKPFFNRLTDRALVVYVDHRGHGRSDRCGPEHWNLDTFADDVVRLCHALGIVKPVVLGQSYGGFVAQRYLARHPAHPGKVILSSTSHHFGLARKLAMFERLGGAASRDAAERFWTDPTPTTWADYERLCRPHYNTTPPADPEAKARSIAVDDILFHTARHEMPTMDLRPGLAGVQCPVLVLHGDADPVTPIEDAREIVAALPARWVRFQAFEQVGHGAWRDKPDAALAVLREFLSDAST
jgi:pimeloyl-ACP methyl ester carboxylesterase